MRLACLIYGALYLLKSDPLLHKPYPLDGRLH